MLHVMNGDAMRPIFEGAGLPGAMTVYADPLHDGPVPGGLSDEELRDVRARHLASATESPEAVAQTLRDWDAALESAVERDEIVLWFEHDLFDQVLLMRHLAWFARRPAGARLSLICIEVFPGIQPFLGLGQLSPQQLASLFDTRVPITEDHLELGQRAWKAFTFPDPRALERVASQDLPLLPFLGRALRRFLEEYPAVGSGLPRTEREILRQLAEGARESREVFSAMHQDGEAFLIGDLPFRDRLDSLAEPPTPLIAIEEAGSDDAARDEALGVLPRGPIAITDMGRRVLEGAVDWLALREFDRWFGGVHVSHDNLWRWNEAAGRIERG